MLLIAGAVAVLLGTSSDSAPSQPFYYSVKELRRPCGGASFLPTAAARSFLDQPPPKDWLEVRNHPQSVPVNSDTVVIRLRAGSASKVTLEGIKFQVRHLRRPPGTILYPGCIATLSGWLIATNFDSTPPRVEIADFPEATQRIHFPWTLSVKEPVTLYLEGGTLGCNCAWRGEIPWVSGSQHGRIVLAEGGKDFKITYSGGLDEHTANGTGWN